MLGIFGQLLGLTLSVFMFEQFDGSGFNFLNHTLSELGSYGRFQYAVVLNGGLFFGGLCVVLSCLLSVQLGDSPWRLPFFISLGLSFLALAAMGLFPINVYHLHIVAIKYFFVFGCVSLLFYGVYLLATNNKPVPLYNKISAVLAFLAMGAFLALPWFELGLTEGNSAFYNEMLVDPLRPEIWWPAITQWAGLATFLLWSALVINSIKADAH
ncbi:DUF998 domain-containing protein [Shewanella pneumatophori]|uniref:DUF998 domain-containing protein n=1 Tax=Shewanella pneumatophori TaxID=314092 RepID=A0A9X2CG22_9GAMM|nr:DUF998 domain-containing protein [Shewanella pneumatophori]MCL1138466.1 DUF998 domain-containing protein [Shewanella pneumatophori]